MFLNFYMHGPSPSDLTIQPVFEWPAGSSRLVIHVACDVGDVSGAGSKCCIMAGTAVPLSSDPPLVEFPMIALGMTYAKSADLIPLVGANYYFLYINPISGGSVTLINGVVTFEVT